MTVENLEAEPAESAQILGAQLPIARAFTENLARHGEELGLIGPLELPRLWSRHILNSALVAPLLRPGRVGDIGSGAGLPGLVLGIARPDVDFILIEPMERRVAWLNDQVNELELKNVTVLRSRAEEVVLDEPLDQVTARAVSAFRKLLPLTAPLLRDGGELVLMKGINAEAEVAAAAKEIRRFRVSDIRVDVLGEGVTSEVTRVVRGFVRA
ncbi:16S rRNA (guanine(527)-N(7))-methyltransferase RsmG [Mycetocola tolaasinivorans]|uniref:Ribosomal RNA small subunit methyltransferase G n=1 Tax=Mycetocola tolaasinivorans TaxID=76635 RepID=A0A3L7A6P5_9MICO|nr:16S rRNA (guanine(527)-N(7))-methyltransferase RsmG [Mycetocola tolaasinivorans]RLP75231.1 16S rRNA (guanine(527)-N(7))-methyltransferase RsmG [Mycetocola tolaasinivorans]